MRFFIVSLCLLAFLLLAACTKSGESTPPTSDSGLGPGPLLSPTAIGEPFLWRQRVSARWDDRKESFDAVLQLHDDELMLMGMSPLGRPGFIIRLDESRVWFENRTGRSLPFPPEHIIADVQKVFYPWLSAAPPGFTGTRVSEHGILTVTETHVLGELRERTFRRGDAPDRGEIRVRYEGWHARARAPERAVLESAWFGYELTIVTVAQQSLTASDR